uniref:Uncharacterized protein n=1 Tax=Panagrolaimus sp. ES5 TaxID=591445 RepID=A0AC34GGP6_9BILA
DIHPTSILSQYMEPKTASYTAEVKSKVSTMADIVKPKPLELAQEKLLNQWKQPPNIKATTDTTQRETEPSKSVDSKTKMEHTLEPKIQNLITMNDTVQSSKIQKFMNDIEQFQTERSKKETATPERAISPTNTTSSDASSSLKSYHSFSNQRVNVAVQTDETSFPQTFNAAPISQRLDSVNYDSGNQSSLCSPAFALSNRRPSSNSNYSANVRLNDTRHREFSYEPNIRKSSDRSSTLGNEYYNEEDLSPKVSFLFKNQSFAVEVCHNGEKGKLKN